MVMCYTYSQLQAASGTNKRWPGFRGQYVIHIQWLIQRGGTPPSWHSPPPPPFVAITLYYYAMFSAINVYTSASDKYSPPPPPPLAKNPVSIPDIQSIIITDIRCSRKGEHLAGKLSVYSSPTSYVHAAWLVSHDDSSGVSTALWVPLDP